MYRVHFLAASLFIIVCKMNSRRKHVLLFALGALIFGGVPVFAVAGQWSNSGATIYYTDGNVGLGTTAAGARLEVNRSVSIGGMLSSGQAAGLQFLDIGTQHVGFRWSDDGTKNLILEDASLSQNPDTWYNNDLANLIVRNGKIGINTTAPNAPLHAKGNAGIITVEGNTFAHIQYYPQGFSNGRKAWVGFGLAGTNEFTIKNEAGGNIVFNPLAGKVIVDGEFRAKSIKVTNSPWADYVFEDDYDLKSLNEVENFIKDNGHLPNIPSAKEIEKGELDLADMQRLQMEKIEELTLYIIQLDEKLNKLENENKVLKDNFNLSDTKI